MPDTSAGSVLTDGTGVSPITASKLVKDFVADFLLAAAAALATAQIIGLEGVVKAPETAAFAVGGALIRSVYRIALRWATS